MLHILSLRDWVAVAYSLLLFLGPGALLAVAYRRDAALPGLVLSRVALSVAFALVFWPVLFIWLHLFRFQMGREAVLSVAVLGWLFAFVVWRRGRPRISADQRFRLGYFGLFFWGILALSTAANLWVVRDLVAAPGSDGFHHTFFTEEILARGGIPDDLLPLTAVASFSYHFGFHVVAAVIAWLSGVSPVYVVLLLGQILKPVAALTTAFWMGSFFHSTERSARISMLAAAAVVAILAVFPAYYINWGRKTQLTGMVLLPVLWFMAWQWGKSRLAPKHLPYVALLAAGLSMTHIRIFLAGMLGVLLIVALNSGRFVRKLSPGQIGSRLVLGGGLGVVAVTPWLVHVWRSRQQGYPVDIGPRVPVDFRIALWGPKVLTYPTNGILLLCALLGLVWGLYRRNLRVLFLSLWVGLVYLVADPRIAGLALDRGTVVAAFWLPVAIGVGYFVAWMDRFLSRWTQASAAGLLGALILLVIGANALVHVLDPNSIFVEPSDAVAMEWIQENTPQDAYFFVNTVTFDFGSSNYVIGGDAGFWIPALARRRAITAPMTYSIERADRPDFGEQLVTFHRVSSELTSPSGLQLLAREGITHVYLGQRGGIISPSSLQESPAFRLVYQQDEVYIFQFLGDGSQSLGGELESLQSQGQPSARPGRGS